MTRSLEYVLFVRTSTEQFIMPVAEDGPHAGALCWRLTGLAVCVDGSHLLHHGLHGGEALPVHRTRIDIEEAIELL